ncbi:class I SAM-dependent methyltransferase [Pollutimonas harenae]|uniref:SAM-dependent methyltransferase n=1 Tax=Pollutimonas harenae TaxID=657015 RepID=A0A853H7F7_9BURK|nr:SAM-dependent methyltransferase [Pollutimonas harenae]NYT86433.1 SAM-dependent methyltransferase [Pollutimonas harenae]TEA69816.1 SAM-dependent methyltransferase [Pollutimonas harenae]
MTALGYQTKLERIAVAGVEDLLIRSLLDRQQYHDPTGVAQRLGICSAAWPLFGMLWPSGIQLAARMAQRPVCQNERILEIGCGLALASLVGHRRGARVTASDCHPLASTFLDHNLQLNDLDVLKYRHGQWGGGLISSELIDMGVEVLSARYDLIMGSDLLYDRDMPAKLADFIDDHALPSAEVWIVDPNRGHRPAFNRQMASFGFELTIDEHLHDKADVDVSGVPTEAYKGRLLIYRRAAAGFSGQ